MSSQYIAMGTNIVCTNMTKPTPLKITTPSRICTALSEEGKPVLRVVDCKISDCFVCRMPIMKWGGLNQFLLGVAVGALVAVAAIAIVCSGGFAGAAAIAIGAAIIPATGTACLTAAAISAATMWGSDVKLGSDIQHLCDSSLDATWKIAQPNTIIEGEQAILSHSFLPCPQGGLITLIIDDELAEEAARLIAERNEDVVDVEFLNQFLQGVIGGISGVANPISLAITAVFALSDAVAGYEDDDLNVDQYEILKTDPEFEYDYAAKTEEIAVTTAVDESIQEGIHYGSDNKIEGGTLSTSEGNWDNYKGKQEHEAKVMKKAQKDGNDAKQRKKKLSKKSSKMMKGRARYAQQKASHSSKIATKAAKETQHAFNNFVKRLVVFGWGVTGAVFSMGVDAYYKKEEYDMTRGIIRELKGRHKKDMKKLIIVSDGE